MERANRYVYKIYQSKSFSSAAKELYISQPSLSATVKKLEGELGFEIFNRSTTPLSLTREGRIYIEYLEEAMINEKNMHHRVKLLSRISREKLVVTGTNFLSYKIVPKVFGLLHEKHPLVELTVDFGARSSKNELYTKLENGTVDLMINYDCDERRFSYIPLQNEKLVVAIRRDGITDKRLLDFAIPHSEIVSGKIDTSRIISDHSLFEKVEFLRVSKHSSIQKYVHRFIENGSISSCYTHNANSLDAHYNMMLNGLGAIVTTDYLIKNIPENHDVMFFITDYSEGLREAKILYKKGRKLSGIAKEFVEEASNLLNKCE